jgi:hypothetical protein
VLVADPAGRDTPTFSRGYPKRHRIERDAVTPPSIGSARPVTNDGIGAHQRKTEAVILPQPWR